MCNAWNHRQNCACGFGPPYPGTITPIERQPWLQAAIGDEGRFREALQDLGFSAETIEEDLQQYQEAVRPAFAAGDFPRALARLQTILRRHKHKVEETTTREINVPLFKLHSPKVVDARVTYQETTAAAKRRGWLIEILGTGMGANQTLAVEYSNAYECQNGDYELIFAPVTLRVSRVAFREKGKGRRIGLRTEVEPSIREHGLPKRVKTLPPEELARDLRLADLLDEFLLAETATRLINTRRWEVEGERECHLGVKAFRLAATVTAKVSRRKEVKLTSELPGGHDYRLLDLRKERGIVWKVD